MGGVKLKNLENSNLLNNLKVLYIEDEDFTRNELSIFLKRRIGEFINCKKWRGRIKDI